jgi:hypothetical protein
MTNTIAMTRNTNPSYYQINVVYFYLEAKRKYLRHGFDPEIHLVGNERGYTHRKSSFEHDLRTFVNNFNDWASRIKFRPTINYNDVEVAFFKNANKSGGVPKEIFQQKRHKRSVNRVYNPRKRSRSAEPVKKYHF